MTFLEYVDKNQDTTIILALILAILLANVVRYLTGYGDSTCRPCNCTRDDVDDDPDSV